VGGGWREVGGGRWMAIIITGCVCLSANTYNVTEFPELCPALVVETELEGCVCVCVCVCVCGVRACVWCACVWCACVYACASYVYMHVHVCEYVLGAHTSVAHAKNRKLPSQIVKLPYPSPDSPLLLPPYSFLSHLPPPLASPPASILFPYPSAHASLSLTILCNISVDLLHGTVVLEQLQHVAVGLPQKLHPGCQKHTIRTLLSSFSTHRTEEQTERECVFMTMLGKNGWLGTGK